MDYPTSGLLSQVAFSIMFALSLKPRHGYQLMQQIKQDSLGKLLPGPGTLYGTIRHLNDANLVEEMPAESANDRRRRYRLTKKGWDHLENEIKYYENIVQLGQKRHLLVAPPEVQA